MLTYFSITQQGENHIRKQIPCQDFSAASRIHSDSLDRDFVVALVSDGVGSCEFSQFGSETAVKAVLGLAEKELPLLPHEPSDEEMLDFLRHCFHHALYAVEADARSRELPMLEFDCTLTAAIYDGSRLWFGHIGDDGLVALFEDGTCTKLTTRHKGHEIGSVYPLIEKKLWQFGTADHVASFALMTDGILDYCVDGLLMDERIFLPFLEPALTEVMENDRQADLHRQDWDRYLSGAEEYPQRFRDAVTDDISLVVVQNPALVAELPEISFDAAQWDADTRKYIEETEDRLYADYRAFKAGTLQPRVKHSSFSSWCKPPSPTVPPADFPAGPREQDLREPAPRSLFSSAEPQDVYGETIEVFCNAASTAVHALARTIQLAGSSVRKARCQEDPHTPPEVSPGNGPGTNPESAADTKSE